MKRLKRYQYERYAILCRASYPVYFDHTHYGFSPHGRRDIYDRWGRCIIRVLWREDDDAIVVFRGSQTVWDWLLNCACTPKAITIDDKKMSRPLGVSLSSNAKELVLATAQAPVSTNDEQPVC